MTADRTLPKVSIVMPTFNSEKTLGLALASIRRQTYPADLIEVLVVDGGSTDRTLALAAERGARVLPNPKTQQEYAKHIGLREATGKFAVFLDSDEVFEDAGALRHRVAVFQEHPELHLVLSGGYLKPRGASSVNDYINIYSDPFAWFMYGTSSEPATKITTWNARYPVSRIEADCTLYDFHGAQVLPLVDMCAGNTLDLDYLRSEFPVEMENESIVPRLFYLMVKSSGLAAVLHNDAITHHSADSYWVFLTKLRWRVVANLHYRKMPGTGFSNREEFQPHGFRLRKFLFIPYGLTVLFPLLESLRVAWRSRKSVALLHAPLAFVTALMILYYAFLKVLGLRPALRSYGDGTKELEL